MEADWVEEEMEVVGLEVARAEAVTAEVAAD
jgi:hypothetical protein